MSPRPHGLRRASRPGGADDDCAQPDRLDRVVDPIRERRVGDAEPEVEQETLAPLALLRQHGVTDVVLACSYRVEDVQAVMGDGEALGVRLRYAVEPAPLKVSCWRQFDPQTAAAVGPPNV